MSWLFRLPIYLLAVGGIVVLLSCDLQPLADLPWIGVCQAIGGPPPIDPLEMRIIPRWYSLPFYAVLRSVTINVDPLHAKDLAVLLLIVVLLAPLVLVFTNWSRTPGRAFLSLTFAFGALIGLGWCGAQRPTEEIIAMSAALVALYLVTFLVVFPLLARRQEPSPAAPSD